MLLECLCEYILILASLVPLISNSTLTPSARECPTLSAPPNGKIDGCSPGMQTTGRVCTFECDDGYTLVGSSSRFCTPRGKWTGTASLCEPLKCDRLTAPSNSALRPPCGNEYTFSCTVQCNFGYRLDGPLQQTCDLNGPDMVDWTDPPTCIGK